MSRLVASGACPPGHDLDDFEVHHARVDAIIAGSSGEAIPLLQDIQREFGFLPRNVLRYVCQVTKLELATLYGIATFYSSFFVAPRGKRVLRVCTGTACHVRGAPRVTTALENHLKIASGETTHDLEFTLETVACLGCCSLAPVVSDNGAIVARLDQQNAVARVIDQAPEAEES